MTPIHPLHLPPLTLRLATDSDISAIVDIHNRNVQQPNTSHPYGFLLAETTPTDIAKHLRQGRSIHTDGAFASALAPGEVLYFVMGQDCVMGQTNPIEQQSTQTAVGFVTVAKPKITDEFFSQLIWLEGDAASSLPTKLLHPNHLYIQTVAITPELRGQGIGRLMYKFLYRVFPNAYFSTFIVSHPLCNHYSIQFHQKQGFRSIALVRRPQFLNFQDYESTLMLRE